MLNRIVLLEPFNMTHVFLFIPANTTFKGFPFISKNCHEMMPIHNANPTGLSSAPRDILKYFPNTNTIVVEESSHFGKTHTVPDTTLWFV